MYSQFMMHGQKNIKSIFIFQVLWKSVASCLLWQR